MQMKNLRPAVCLAVLCALFHGMGCFNPAGDSVGPNGVRCHTENVGFLFTAHVETKCVDANGNPVNLSSGSAPSSSATP